jgi:hypothetical protein
LISVDELRAAGALDVPPEWRKSLSAGCKPPREPMLFGDDDLYPEVAPSTASDAEVSCAEEATDDEAVEDDAR